MFTRRSRTRIPACPIMRAILLVLITASLCAVSATAAQMRSVPSALVARARQVTGDNFQFVTSTPRGVTVVARSQPRAEVLRAIDQGFSDLFAVAARNGYRNRLNYGDYTVFIGRADRVKDSSGQYSPDIAVGAAQYAGSEYDQGGFIYAAGMVLAFNPGAFVIAEHERDFGQIANVVRYEGEHIVLYYNNRALYERTADHSRGGSHPILR
jgi:hypothetical protein